MCSHKDWIFRFLFVVIPALSSINSAFFPDISLSDKSIKTRCVSVPPETIEYPSSVNLLDIALAFETISLQ